MRVKILRNTRASGFRCAVGDTPDLSEEDASRLISMGKAEPIKKAAPKKKTRRAKGEY